MKKKNEVKIDKSMNLGELISSYPKLGEVLANDYGLHCVNCFAAGFDTLEEGAKIHGFDDKDIKEMVKKLNEIVDK